MTRTFLRAIRLGRCHSPCVRYRSFCRAYFKKATAYFNVPRYAITSARSAGLGSPANAIFVPGTIALGFVSQLFKVSEVQVIPEAFSAAE